MHECRLCERDMKTNKSLFGAGCVNNIYKFLNIDKPARGKDKEQTLYKNIMQRTKASRLNNNQKTWLTDRYLTFQYLDKLKYGNFDSIKRNINKDISNMNRIKNVEEIVTMRELKLKEAYDLYKRERKFENQIKEIKNTDSHDNEKIKLLLTSMSYLFNFYRNKNQYNNDNLKAMQYGKNKSEFEVKGGDVGLQFDNSDLYFSIHGTDSVIIGKKINSKWYLNISIVDRYDFTKFKFPKDYYLDANSIPKSVLSSILYNYAFISQKLGVIKEYYIKINFDYEVD